MGNTTKIIVAVVVVAAIAVGAVAIGNKSGDNDKNGGTTNTPGTSDNSGNGQSTDEIAATITYTNSGFSPSSVTVSSGSTIEIVNNSDDTIKPSSDPHPTHTDNPELNFSDIEPGQSATKTLTAKGTWGYHNHYQDDRRGTIVVD